MSMIRSKRLGLLGAVGIVSLATLMTSCAMPSTKRAEKEVAQETKAEPARRYPGELSEAAREIIKTAQGVSDEQKTRLLEITDSVSKQIYDLRGEASQMKAVLFKELVSNDGNPKAVKVLKKKITKNYHDQLKVMFDALEQSQIVLGRKMQSDEELMKTMMMRLDSIGGARGAER